MLQIEDSIILITGANGGIGSALVNEFISRGAKKIYATGLRLDDLNELAMLFPSVVIPLVLDVTNTASIEACVRVCSDVNMLINNAGVEFKVPFISEKSKQAAVIEMNVNYIGVVEMINLFLPTLKKNRPAAIVNILSLASLVTIKRLGNYCASKTATHVLTQAIRSELKEKNIQVIGVYPGYVNTIMVPEEVTTLKSEPRDIAFQICEGIQDGLEDIFPDEVSQKYVIENPIEVNYFE